MADKQPSQILIVDDELSMREVLEYMLTREGYRVSLAESGKEAIRRISGTDFDLILCDIRLGDVSGIVVLNEAKKKIFGHGGNHDFRLRGNRGGGGGHEQRGL